eukprot:g15903.t1
MLSYFHSQRGPGCFLELGPSDGANSISNFLEKDHGWRGILVEPSPSQRMTLERREGSLILNGGLAKQVCTRDWIEVYQNGGVQRGHFGFEDALDAGELAFQEQISNVVRTSVVSFPLKAVLDKVNLTRLNFEYQIDVLHIERKRLICRFLTRFLNPFRRWWWACDRVGADEAKLERLLSSAGYTLERTLLTEINGAEAVRTERLENWPLPFYWTREVTVSLFFFRNPAVRDPPEEELKNVAEALSENKFLNERITDSTEPLTMQPLEFWGSQSAGILLIKITLTLSCQSGPAIYDKSPRGGYLTATRSSSTPNLTPRQTLVKVEVLPVGKSRSRLVGEAPPEDGNLGDLAEGGGFRISMCFTGSEMEKPSLQAMGSLTPPTPPAPVTYVAPAPVTYTTMPAVSYTAPVTYTAAPVTYVTTPRMTPRTTPRTIDAWP